MTMHVLTNLCIHHHCIGVLDGAQVNFFCLISFTNRSESPSHAGVSYSAAVVAFSC